ncbi:MAG: DUF1501 domain-containing protein [Armatimonadetes bacterium]|nr:DUF1501 domain-containing protein [Armatimonadota bacterium]
MDPREQALKEITRRYFLERSGASVIGSVGLAMMLNERLFASSMVSDRSDLSDMSDKSQGKRSDPFAPKAPHFTPKAKAVIFLNMTGAPSQPDLFDYKPALAKLDGQPIPESALAGLRLGPFTSTDRNTKLVFQSPWSFKQYGQSGMWISELLPHTAEIVDEVTFIRSMHTNEINHVPAQLLFSTGSPRQGRPTMGSWVTYGLGSECEDLPGFIVLTSGKSGRCGTTCWGSGFLPSVYQGVPFRSAGEPVLYLNNPPGVDADLRRQTLDAIKEINHGSLAGIGDPEIATRIEAYEMAYKMQTSVPGLMDISSESQATLEMYGAKPGEGSFSNNCLLARRLVERGVRFVQIDHGGWDHHGGGDQNLITGLPDRCKQVDQGGAALIKDLKARGMLDSTLVIWGGEFGRQPMSQNKPSKQDAGRDHLRSAFTIWMAGGGIKRGQIYGATDDFGISVADKPMHIHDLQATILHCLGIEHTRLTFKHQGREFRLTDVEGQVADGLLA